MNAIQSKDHRIGTYEINKFSLSCFDDKIYMSYQDSIFSVYTNIFLVFSLLKAAFFTFLF